VTSGGTIAVDFDGVIHGYSKGWQDGTIYDPPVPGAIETLNTLLGNYSIFVFTSRPVDQVTWWLRNQFRGKSDVRITPDYYDEGSPGNRKAFWNNRYEILVTNWKLAAKYYIDDRGVRFRNWEQVLYFLQMSEATETQQRERPDSEEIPLEEVAVEVCSDILTAPDLSTAVYLALGAASMCWSEVPAGVFEDSRAKLIGQALMQYAEGVHG
jgi:hypothetical protein